MKMFRVSAKCFKKRWKIQRLHCLEAIVMAENKSQCWPLLQMEYDLSGMAPKSLCIEEIHRQTLITDVKWERSSS